MDNPFEAPKPNSTKVATKWAVIYAITAIVFILLFQFLNIAQDSAVRYISLIPFIAFMVLAQIEYRTLLGGNLTYGQGFSSGFRYALFGGILLALFMFIYISYINTQFIVQTMEIQRAKMQEKGLSDDQIDKAMAMSSKFMGPVMFSFTTAVSTAIMGAILALITSAIVKKDPVPFDPQAFQDEKI